MQGPTCSPSQEALENTSGKWPPPATSLGLLKIYFKQFKPLTGLSVLFASFSTNAPMISEAVTFFDSTLKVALSPPGVSVSGGHVLGVGGGGTLRPGKLPAWGPSLREASNLGDEVGFIQMGSGINVCRRFKRPGKGWIEGSQGKRQSSRV